MKEKTSCIEQNIFEKKGGEGGSDIQKLKEFITNRTDPQELIKTYRQGKIT